MLNSKITSLLFVLLALFLFVTSISGLTEMVTGKSNLFSEIFSIFNKDSAEGKELKSMTLQAIVLVLSSFISIVLFISGVKSIIQSSFVKTS